MALATVAPEVAAGECNLDALADRALSGADWVMTDAATAELTVSTPVRAATMTLDVRVILGPLTYHWVEGPFAVGSAESALRTLVIPDDAFLHAAAEDYVADLIVQAHFQDQEGYGLQESALPVAYVAWPDGREGPAMIWSKADLAAYAPDGRLGIHPVDPYTSHLTMRYVAPIGPEVNKARTVSPDEGRARVTVPVDDQSNEEVR